MFESYPVMLNIVRRKAVVVGGGRIAYRKITSLLKAGAHVTVISPEIHERVKQLVDAQQIEWREKPSRNKKSITI